jgi:hypothetical protein
LLARLARDLVFPRPRDFREDAKACVANLHSALHVLGQANIPQRGSCVLTINHYHRRGFGAQWLALAVSALVPVPVHWVISSEFMYQGRWYATIGSIGSHILLNRIAQIYGFTTMPPMPPRPKDVAARAASVRAVLHYVMQTKNAVLGLAPEGFDPPGGILTRPARGLGRFGLLLSRAGMIFIPVGLYEADGRLHLHFGERYELSVRSDLSSHEKDERAIQIIMKNIACLLPLHLRGEFV